MGLEPTVSDVTGRRFNQLSYISFQSNIKTKFILTCQTQI